MARDGFSQWGHAIGGGADPIRKAYVYFVRHSIFSLATDLANFFAASDCFPLRVG